MNFSWWGVISNPHHDRKKIMGNLVIKRAIYSIIVLWGISTMIFFLLRLSGDPTDMMLSPEATYEERQEYRHSMGFDRPLSVQYVIFLKDVIRLDFGESLRYKKPAMSLVFERLPATLELSAVGLGIALLFAIPLGIISALKRGTWLDSLGLFIAMLGQSFPVFWLGIMLILLFSENLHFLPSGGTGNWKNLILPGLTLSALTMATVMRILRSSLIDQLESDYMRTAKAKGLTFTYAVLRHALKNAAIPVVTIIGISIGLMLGGAIITETVFAWPGMGRLLTQAVTNRDYPIVQAFVFLNGVIILVLNFIVDILYTLIDPRVRVS
jgi:peptide/nickel transport system permease protein